MIDLGSPTADSTRRIGQTIGAHLQAGDLVLLHGDLGAGKTTLTQGIAAGMQVSGRVMSPTFVVARTHESLQGGPNLVHVDAYRIEDNLDLETLDLESSLATAVTVVEWGAGKAEIISESRLEIELSIIPDGSSDWSKDIEEARRIRLIAVGDAWIERLDIDFVAAFGLFDPKGD